MAQPPCFDDDGKSVTLRRRLLNLARTEATFAATRLRTAATGLFETASRPVAEPALDPEYAQMRAEVEAEMRNDGPAVSTRRGLEPPEVRRFYANLELPLGASASEVKAAYRRLMRRYHPDKHHRDPERAEAANQLAQQLREAYEGLLTYLRSP